jgi:hypothetical protein
MIRTAVIILAIELALIGWVRWRYGARTAERGGDRRQEPATSV